MTGVMLVEWTVRITVLLASAWGVDWLCRRHAASTRHAIWAGALLGVLLVTIGGAVLPRWTVFPALPRAMGGTGIAHLTDGHARRSPTPGFVRSSGVDGAEPRADGRTLDASVLAAGAWGTGTVLLLLRLAIGWRAWRRLRAGSIEAPPLLVEDVSRLARHLQITRAVQTRLSVHLSTPCTAGSWSPVIVLPAAAADWTASRRRHILMHELAHVSRHDATLGAVAQMIKAAVWWHPLVWVACHRRALLAEVACDDIVLLDGARRSGYADDLLSLSTQAPVPGVALARRPTVTGRIEAVLDTSRARATHASKSARVARAAFVGLAMPLSTLSTGASRPLGGTPPSMRVNTPSGLRPALGMDRPAPVMASGPSVTDTPRARPTRAMPEGNALRHLRRAASPDLRFEYRERTRLLMAAVDEWSESRRTRELLFTVLDDMPSGRDRARVLSSVLRLPRGSPTARRAIELVHGLSDSRDWALLLARAARRGDLPSALLADEVPSDRRRSDRTARRQGTRTAPTVSHGTGFHRPAAKGAT